MLSVFPFFPFADSRLLKRAVTQRSHLLQLFHCQLEPSVDLHRGLGPFVPLLYAPRSKLFEIAFVFVCFNHVARLIVNANQSPV
jgi:hypothetical protein